MYRLRFLATMLKCFLRPTRGLMETYPRRFFAIPFIDTDVSRLFTQTYSLYAGICRWDFMFGSPFRNAALTRGWVPITTSEVFTYKRAIKAFSLVTVETRLLCWTEKRLYLEQNYHVRGELHARCLIEGMIRGPKGVLAPPQAFGELGFQGQSPPVPADVEKFLALTPLLLPR
jgi:acyl-CoA thioesterase FadM